MKTMCFYESFTAVTCKLLPCFAMEGRHSRWDTDTDRRRYHVCPSTETLSLTYLPDRVHFSYDYCGSSQTKSTAHCFNSMCITKFSRSFLSTYQPKPDLKVASEDQIIEALLSLDNMKIAYDVIKVLELVRNVKIVYFDTESMNFINVLLESAKEKAVLNSWKAWR